VFRLKNVGVAAKAVAAAACLIHSLRVNIVRVSFALLKAIIPSIGMLRRTPKKP
jgi:hypothetical protein